MWTIHFASADVTQKKALFCMKKGHFRRFSGGAATGERAKHGVACWQKPRAALVNDLCRVGKRALPSHPSTRFALYFAPFRVRNRKSKWQAKRLVDLTI